MKYYFATVDKMQDAAEILLKLLRGKESPRWQDPIQFGVFVAAADEHEASLKLEAFLPPKSDRGGLKGILSELGVPRGKMLKPELLDVKFDRDAVLKFIELDTKEKQEDFLFAVDPNFDPNSPVEAHEDEAETSTTHVVDLLKWEGGDVSSSFATGDREAVDRYFKQLHAARKSMPQPPRTAIKMACRLNDLGDVFTEHLSKCDLPTHEYEFTGFTLNMLSAALKLLALELYEQGVARDVAENDSPVPVGPSE